MFQLSCRFCILSRVTLNQITTFKLHTSAVLRQTAKDVRNKRISSTLYYVAAAGIATVGLSYAAVPLYRMFCQAYSYGGTVTEGHDAQKVEQMTALRHRPIKVKFNADLGSSMRWNFKPQQNEITVGKINQNYQWHESNS